jgi:hypothetical protein
MFVTYWCHHQHNGQHVCAWEKRFLAAAIYSCLHASDCVWIVPGTLED